MPQAITIAESTETSETTKITLLSAADRIASVREQLVYSESDLDVLGLLSRKTRYRLRRGGKFPEPKTFGDGKKLYVADEIRRYIDNPELWQKYHQKAAKESPA